MHYTRIYCDAAGDSHFEDVSVDLAPVDFAPPAPPLNLAKPVAAKQVVLSNFPEAWAGDWHCAPTRQFYLQLSGRLQVRVSDGRARELSAGSLVLLEDTFGTGHVTRVVGDSSVDAVFVQLE